MEIRLNVTTEGRHWSGGASIEVPEMLVRTFAPMKSCDEGFEGMVPGEVSLATAEVLMKVREDAADILAREIAEMLVTEMSKLDTYNGFTNEERRI